MATQYREKKMDNNERTPLITTIHIAPPRQRYRNRTVRRFCTIAFCSTLIAGTFFFLLPLVFLPKHLHPHPKPPHHKKPSLSFEELSTILLETPKEEKAQEWSKYYTSGPHLAGKNYSQVLWTQEKWQEFGIKADIVAYDTYINYPLGHRLALFEKSETEDAGASGVEAWKVKFEASLEEDVLEEDPTTGMDIRVPTFHGYSASGNVTAPFVYVNYGTYRDFEDLVNANVSLAGKIAIAKYGGIFRGLKIKRAEELGMIGAVLYSDPGDDGDATDENGVTLYPDGPARQPTSVQRGSAQFLSVAPGDPYVIHCLDVGATNILQYHTWLPIQARSSP
jgi:N-acetylated-alpha-linked acidic dipeptidase